MLSLKPYLHAAPLLIGACLVLAGCGSTKADTHPGQPVTKRRALLHETLRTFEPMGIMVRGKNPYVAADFQALADKLQTLSTQPWAYFPPGSTYAPSRAKPAVWQQSAQFKQAQDTYIKAVSSLDAEAKTGNLDLIRPAYMHVSESCAACHKAFRGPSVL
ncbi:MAG: cytochrome c [Hydrogenophilales bacterium]|nr:cytochrome c [Hydrogenophilales bacterium]